MEKKIKIPRFDDGLYTDRYGDVISINSQGEPHTTNHKYSSIQLDPIVVTPQGNMTEDYYNMLRDARLNSDIQSEQRLRQQSSFQPLYMPDGSVKIVPGEAGLQQISPEFDMLLSAPLMKSGIKSASDIIHNYMYSPNGRQEIPLGIHLPKSIMKPIDKIRSKLTDPAYTVIDGEKVYTSIPERRGHFYRRGAEGMINDANETGTINVLNERNRLSSNELFNLKKMGYDENFINQLVDLNNKGGLESVDEFLNRELGTNFDELSVMSPKTGKKKLFLFTKRSNHTLGGRNINFQKGSIWGSYNPRIDAVVEYNPYYGDGSSFMLYGHNSTMYKDGFGNIVTDQRIPNGGIGLLRGNTSIDQPGLSYWVHNGKGWVNRQFKK